MEPACLRAILARTPGLLARHVRACLTEHQPAGVALPDNLAAQLLARGLPARARSWLERPDHRLIDSDLRWIADHDGEILCCVDAPFPPTLARWGAAPASLYVRGNARLLLTAPLCIVGSRQPTPAGLLTARGFAQELARAGLAIAGALADGIPAAAHAGALDACGASIGVCAAGLDRIQPARHAELAARLHTQGALISVFAPGTPTRRHHFAIRNRLLGALGTGLLAVEAAAGDGAPSSVAQARRLKRPVFAIPGAIRDPAAHTCNQLIRAGASLVTQPGEILRELGFSTTNQDIRQPDLAAEVPGAQPSPLDNKYEMLLDAAGFEPVDIDALVFRTGWTGHEVASMLLLLELQGRVAPQPGGRYCRLS
jgi:DNA processing protein